MRWETQTLEADAPGTLPGLARLSGLVRSVQTPEFAGVTFHEVAAKSVLNRVPGASRMPFRWTVNPYRGCSHACAYCFARPTHTYVGLDAGRDFDAQVIVKVNAAEVLASELARPSWRREPVALGTNTDPYQRAEGKYRLMPGIIDALAASRTPFSILTKGTLIRRDLSRLTAAAREVEVAVALSIPVLDPAVQRTLEPGTPSAAARLDTVAALSEAGLAPSVFMAPVLPFLTDSEEALDAAMRAYRAAGAVAISYEILHLRPGVKEWFAAWLARERPALLPAYRDLYGGGAYVPEEYRSMLRARIARARAAHGLARLDFRPRESAPEPLAQVSHAAPTLF